MSQITENQTVIVSTAETVANTAAATSRRRSIFGGVSAA